MSNETRRKTREVQAAQQPASDAPAAEKKVKLVPVEVEVNGQRLVVDPRTFTVREEYLRRRTLEELDLPATGNFLAAASVWIMLRRERPELTLDEVVDSLTLGAIEDSKALRVDEDGSADDPSR